MPKAYRHVRAAKAVAPQQPEKKRYMIVDPSHRPDMRGELGGVKVQLEGGKKYVRMTDAQAQFYLDSGAITLT